MRVIETKVYTYDELSPPAQEKAREWYAHTDAFDGQVIIDCFVETLSKIGFEIETKPARLMNGKTRQEPCVYWSGFASQGDGASFVARFRMRDFDVSADVPDAYKKDASDFMDEFKRFYRAILRAVPMSTWGEIRHAFIKYAYADITQAGNYCHECTMYCDNANEFAEHVEYIVGDSDYDSDAVFDACSDLSDAIQEYARSLAQNLYKDLNVEYEYQASEEVVAENIRANGYEFTGEGERA